MANRKNTAATVAPVTTTDDTVTDPAQIARTGLGDAVKVAWTGNSMSSGSIARISAGILSVMGNSNSGAALLATRDGKDVNITADVLQRYARKDLPTGKDLKAAATSDPLNIKSLPTSGMLIDAIASTADAVANAYTARDNALALADKAKGVAAKQRHKAEAERLDNALNTMKQPIRRALMVAAYVVSQNDDDDLPTYRLAGAHASDGVLMVPELETDKDGNVVRDDNGEPVYADMPITFANARTEFTKPRGTRETTESGTDGNAAASAPARAETGIIADPKGSMMSVTVTPRAFARGGTERMQLAKVLSFLSGALSTLPDRPTAAEVNSLCEMRAAIDALIDDDAILRANEMAEKAHADREAFLAEIDDAEVIEDTPAEA